MSDRCPHCGGKIVDDIGDDGRHICTLLNPQLPKVWRLIEVHDRKAAMTKELEESGRSGRILWKTFEDGTIVAVGHEEEERECA